MNEVLEIEVDGEIDDQGSFDGDRRSPSWGLPLAVGIAGTLLLAVLLVVVVPTVIDQDEPREPAPAVPAKPSATVAGVIEDAEGALAAWGRFAVSGDLKQLDGWFVPEGPQYRALASEVAGLMVQPPGAPFYQVSLTEPSVTSVTSKLATLRGAVTWHRVGEVPQSYQWNIVLHRTPKGRWLLWTINGGK